MSRESEKEGEDGSKGAESEVAQEEPEAGEELSTTTSPAHLLHVGARIRIRILTRPRINVDNVIIIWPNSILLILVTIEIE